MKTQSKNSTSFQAFKRNSVYLLLICSTFLSSVESAYGNWFTNYFRRSSVADNVARSAVQGATAQITPNRASLNRITDYLLTTKNQPPLSGHELLVITGQRGSGKTSTVLSYMDQMNPMGMNHPLRNQQLTPITIDSLLSKIRNPNSPTEGEFRAILRVIDELGKAATENPNVMYFVPDYSRLAHLTAKPYEDFVKNAHAAFDRIRHQHGLIIELENEYLRQGSPLYHRAAALFGWPTESRIGDFSAERFQLKIVEIPDMTPAEVRSALISMKGRLSYRLGANITDSAIDKAIKISQKMRNTEKAFIAQTLETLERGSQFLHVGIEPFVKLKEDLVANIETLQKSIDELHQPQIIEGEFKRRRLADLNTQMAPLLRAQEELSGKMEALRQHIDILSRYRAQIQENLRKISALETEIREIRLRPESRANQAADAQKTAEMNDLIARNTSTVTIAQTSEEVLKSLGSSVRLNLDADVVVGAQARHLGQTIESVEKLIDGKLIDYFSPDLYEVLRRRIIGQETVLSRVWQNIKTAIGGNRVDPNKPLFVGLFIGATGTGKTELPKQIARDIYLRMAALGHRMSGDINDPNTWPTYAEFNAASVVSESDISKLTGTGPGFVGYGDQQPHIAKLLAAAESGMPIVFVVDEIEKADPALANILLKLANGEPLITGDGKTIPSHNLILVFTSNAITSNADFPDQQSAINHLVSGDWRKNNRPNPFRPEFFRRLNSFAIFNEFVVDHLKRITLVFQETHLRRLQSRFMNYRIDQNLVDLLAHISLGPTNGASILQTNFDNFIVASIDEGVKRGTIKINEGRSYRLSVEGFQPEHSEHYLQVIQVSATERFGVFATERVEVVRGTN